MWAIKSKEFVWKGKVIRRPKSESVLDWISDGYFIDFVSLWDPFWSPDGASLGVTNFDCQFGGSLGVLKSMKFEVSRGQMGFEGFLVNLRSQSYFCVALSSCVYIVFFQCNVAFTNMNDLIYLCKLCVWSAHNAYNAAPAQTPTRAPDGHCERICM